MKKALAIVVYNRFKYFEMVLPSILIQKINGMPVSEFYDIYVFQDGLWEGESSIGRAEHEKIAIMLRLQTNLEFIQQPKNLGVALHFDFIERTLFLEREYDFVVFHEDDLILAPGYMDAIDSMAVKFQGDDRIGMLAAHPGDPTTSLELQRRHGGKYVSMGHNWGFGVARDFWLKRQPFVDAYLNLIRDVPYRERPHETVYQWLQDNGFAAQASSQDYVKQCATAALNAVRISTYGNLGLPIGRFGLHCRPEDFKKMGFDRVVVCDVNIRHLMDFDEKCYQDILAYQQKQVGIKGSGFDFSRWREKIVPVNLQSRESQVSINSRDVIFLQTSDPDVYYPMLLESSKSVRRYCDIAGFEYRSFVGFKRGGGQPWHASYNRIKLLEEILLTGFRGWVVYLDADAYVKDINFDLLDYLSAKAGFAGIFTSGTNLGWWDVNDGVFILNFESEMAREIVRRWIKSLNDIADEQFASSIDWGGTFPDDQKMLQDILRELDCREKVLLEKHDFINSARARFVRTIMRDEGRTISDRIDYIRKDSEACGVEYFAGDLGHKIVEGKRPVLNIPSVPHMEVEGVTLLGAHLSRAKSYLEYGAGGSTIFAASKGVVEIHSVESDKGFLDAVRDRLVELNVGTDFFSYYVDIGPTKEWGQPADAASARKWPRYAISPWENLNKSQKYPDLILIDGRFRVACFLTSAIFAKQGTVILFDDYFDRPQYHVVEKYFDITNRAGRMAEFIIDSQLAIADVLIDLMYAASEPS
ncbi:hypothetical protein [Burkholderia territorii]|uniref:hypothetical protein n=1 Tax=Burkholderia territorii TaxID=1503055 RepID=UPI000B2C3040|nr:hypothetical protein [Burkholderia territorii]